VHDACVEERLTQSRLPTEVGLIVLLSLLILRIGADVRRAGIPGLPVVRESGGHRKRRGRIEGRGGKQRNEPSLIEGLENLRLCIENVPGPGGNIQYFLSTEGWNEGATARQHE